MRANAQVDGAQSIRRAAQILRVVASFAGRGATLGEAVLASGLQKATVHRMLRALCEEGLLEQDELTRNYRIGVGVFALHASMGDRFDIRSLAHVALERIRDQTEDTVYLAIRSGYDGLCLAMHEGTYPEKTLRLSVQDRWPLGVGAFSMPLLAFLPDNEVDEIIEYNAGRLAGHDLYTAAQLRTRVSDARARNYAVNTMEAYPTMCAIGVPVLDAQRRPIASICLTAVISRMPPERRRRIADLLWAESVKISETWQQLRSVGAQADSWRSIPPARAVEGGLAQA
jgi:DNA-binding IclR family transcriptional regulator